MSRPKLIRRLSVRVPEELEQDLQAAADRRRCSLNEVVLTALENELARMVTYSVDYYGVIRRLNGPSPLETCPTMADRWAQL